MSTHQQPAEHRQRPPSELTRSQIERLESIYGNRYLLEPAPSDKLPKAA